MSKLMSLQFFARATSNNWHAGFLTAADTYAWASEQAFHGLHYTVVNIDDIPVNEMGAIL